jgi:hypothetical protein
MQLRNNYDKGTAGVFNGSVGVVTALSLELDVTPAFAATAAAWLAETEPYVEELARLEVPGAFEQRQADRRSMLAPIHAGLLRRALLLAPCMMDPSLTSISRMQSACAREARQLTPPRRG